MSPEEKLWLPEKWTRLGQRKKKSWLKKTIDILKCRHSEGKSVMNINEAWVKIEKKMHV